MKKRTIAVGARRLQHEANKNNIQFIQRNFVGFMHPGFVVMFLMLTAGLVYLYSINQSAVKGYDVRQTEKELQSLKKDNESLKIKEAELKSLYHIEEASKQLNMSEVTNVSYIDESGSVALGSKESR